jgi:holo-[acyl-carrier protein] synthase
MIVGIGTDICDVRRIEAAWRRRGARFAAKVLGDREHAVFERRLAQHEGRGVRYLATRFAAKEAFSKAIGLGIHMPMTWRRCEILNLASGAPQIALTGDLKTWFEAQGWQAHVTMTDEAEYAVAFVVVERAPERLSPLETSR